MASAATSCPTPHQDQQPQEEKPQSEVKAKTDAVLLKLSLEGSYKRTPSGCGSNSQRPTFKADLPMNPWVVREPDPESSSLLLQLSGSFLAWTTYSRGFEEFSSLSFSFESFPLLFWSSCYRWNDCPRVRCHILPSGKDKKENGLT